MMNNKKKSADSIQKKSLEVRSRKNKSKSVQSPGVSSEKSTREKETNAELEQYKILIEIYNEEVSRFYNRQYIYITFQLIVFAGIISGFDKLIKYPIIFRFGILLILIISFFSFLLTKRGYDVQNILIKTIAKFENKNDELILLREFNNVSSKSGSFVITNLNFQSLAALGLSIIIFLFWLILWLFVDLFCNII